MDLSIYTFPAKITSEGVCIMSGKLIEGDKCGEYWLQAISGDSVKIRFWYRFPQVNIVKGRKVIKFWPRLVILNSNQTEYLTHECGAKYGDRDTKSFEWTFNGYGKERLIQDKIIIDGIININLEISLFDPLTSGQSMRRVLASKFSQFENMFKNSILSDFEIICEEKSIKTHKFILSSQSNVFRAMFETNMIESKEKRLVIDDCSYKAVYAMVNFLYTNSIDRDTDVDLFYELFELSDKYDIRDLKIFCEYKLQQEINKENCVHLQQLATAFNAYYLTEQINEFIKQKCPELQQNNVSNDSGDNNFSDLADDLKDKVKLGTD